MTPSAHAHTLTGKRVVDAVGAFLNCPHPVYISGKGRKLPVTDRQMDKCIIIISACTTMKMSLVDIVVLLSTAHIKPHPNKALLTTDSWNKSIVELHVSILDFVAYPYSSNVQIWLYVTMHL